MNRRLSLVARKERNFVAFTVIVSKQGERSNFGKKKENCISYLKKLYVILDTRYEQQATNLRGG